MTATTTTRRRRSITGRGRVFTNPGNDLIDRAASTPRRASSTAAPATTTILGGPRRRPAGRRLGQRHDLRRRRQRPSSSATSGIAIDLICRWPARPAADPRHEPAAPTARAATVCAFGDDTSAAAPATTSSRGDYRVIVKATAIGLLIDHRPGRARRDPAPGLAAATTSLSGGAGNDILIGGLGADVINGGDSSRRPPAPTS